MIICFICKTMWKVESFSLKNEKIFLTFNTFFVVGAFFDAEGSAHDSMHYVSRILGKEVTDACFIFREDSLVDAEVLGKVN